MVVEAMKPTAGVKTMTPQRTTHLYLTQEHWSLLLKAVYEQAGHHGAPTGALGALWRMMVDANQRKRVVFEIEIRD
jgi:hypothetical protein